MVLVVEVVVVLGDIGGVSMVVVLSAMLVLAVAPRPHRPSRRFTITRPNSVLTARTTWCCCCCCFFLCRHSNCDYAVLLRICKTHDRHAIVITILYEFFFFQFILVVLNKKHVYIANSIGRMKLKY